MGAALGTGAVVGPKNAVKVAEQAVGVAGQAGTIALDALKKTPDVAARFANGAVIVADSAASVVKSAEDIGKAGVDAAEKIGQAGVRVGKAVAPYVKKGLEVGAEVGEVGLEVGAVAAAAAGGGIAYDIAQNMYGGYSGGSSYSGGCGYFGGNKDDDPILSIKDFSQSRAFETKDKVIKQLAKALSSVGINVNENDDADTIVKALVSQIPNPKNGKTFSSDAESQAKVCKAVATALNNVFTPFATKPEEMLVDTSLGTAEMCRLIAEWAHSFSIGVNTEFLAVHASVKNALRAVVMYDGVMSQIWSKIQDKMQLDDNMDRELSPLIEVYNRAQSERRRQELLLNNILHTNLDPADRELANAMADDSKQNILIKKIGLRPGTTEFADTLAMAISGLGTAASIAQRVNKALKTVGMSINEYLSGKDYKEFQNMLDSKFEELMMNKKNLNRKEVHKFLKAAATIRDSFDHKNDSRFKNALNGRQDNIMGGADDDEDDPDGAPITSTGKMVKEFNAEKKNIINEFVKRMSKNYEELLIPIKAMSRKLGTEIPVTDKTDVLRDSLVRLSEMYDEHQKIEFSLIGMYKTAEDRQRKARYVNNLRALAVACSSLMENALYSSVTSYFVQLKEAISKIQKTIDYFSDIITSKYGGEVEGGGDDDLLAGEIAKSTLILKEVVNEFAYFYYIANVKSNFEQTSAELDKYSVKYNELLGDAVASRIYTLEKEYRNIMAKNFKETTTARVDDDTPLAEEVDNEIFQHQGQGQMGEGQMGVGQRVNVILGGTPDEKIKAARKKWIKAEYDCKIKFYRVLQAIDLYMKAFTVAIVKDPNAVRDIKKILDSTQVIARWFNEETGNNIWKSFEMMDATTPENVKNIKEFTSGHYYEFVSEQVALATANNMLHPLPRHHYSQTLNGDSSEKNTLTQAQKYIDQSIDFYQGLKNLVNAFIRIGDIFGGNELHSQSFMSPSQIFQGLTRFLKQSALSSSDDSIKTVTFSDVESLNFKVESMYFTLIIKSMAAKILTTLGVYDMFERSTPITEINHTRIITGGALETPEVLEGASELYFRLPRLIEFYRRFLYWDGESDTDVYKIIKDSEDRYKIAMLPELEGIFANIIRLIFQKAVSADIGEYSDSELRTIVTEINNIYSHFHEKKPGQATKSALSEFVIEINRRYGVIKKKDMQDYWKMIKKERNPQELFKENDTNYSILPNENQTEINRRAPSDRYLVQQPIAIDSTGLQINPRTQKPFDPYVGRIEIGLLNPEKSAKTLVDKFRKELDKVYSISRTNPRGRAVYSLMIHQAEIEIKQAASADAKLKIAFRLIQGADKIATDINKAVMFHETVIVGLSSLNAIYVILSRFSDKLLTMNPVTIEKAIMDASYLFNLGLSKDNKQITSKVYSNAGLPDDINNLINEVLPKYADGRSSKLTINPNNISSTPTRFSKYIDTSEYLYFTPAITMAVKSLDDRKALLASSFIYDKTGDRYAAANDNYENILVNSDNLSLLNSIGITSGREVAIIEYLQTLKVMAHKTVKYDEIMTDFIELVYGLSTSTQGLVEVRFTQNNNDGYIQFGFSKLKELVENIMIDVKLYFEQFRPYFSKTLIEKYENKTKVGSIFWLEENLFDKMIRPPFDDKLKSNSLSGISRRANSIFQGLLRNHGYKLRKSDSQLNYSLQEYQRRRDIVDFNDRDDVKLCHHAYGNALSQLLYYGDESFLYKKYDGYDKSTYPLSNLMSTGRPNKATTRDPEPEMKHPKTGDDNATVRYLFYDSEESFTQHRSILFLFNQLMARYLNTVVDKSGEERVYFPLINSIANGVMSNSVTNPGKETFPDILSILADDISLKIGGPKPTAILFHSLALILQRLIKDSNPITQVSYHLLSTLTDVPLYMKESYRVNLPGFVKLFDFVYQKCEFIKQFIQKTPNLNLSKMELRDSRDNKLTVKAGIKVRDDFTGVASERVNVLLPRDSLYGIKEFNETLIDKDVKEYFLEFIDSVSNACYVVSNSAMDVLKELGDMPVYGQLYENSIEMYQNRNGKLPLTPISIIFSFLANTKTSEVPLENLEDLEDLKRSVLSDPLVFPNKTLGDPKFKLLYANRQVIMQSTQIGYDQIPGVKAIVDTYNSVSSSTDRLDDERYLRFLNNVITGVRFVVDIRSYKVQMTSTYCFPSVSYISSAVAPTAAAAAVGAVAVAADLKTPTTNLADNATVTIYFMDKLPSAIISILETAAQTDTYTEIAKHVDGDKSKGTTIDRRQQERIDNLMDMNIIPINVHALMRDIPLVNLYNYDFTFNQMLDDMYLNHRTAEYRTDLASRLFIELTKDPYKALPSPDETTSHADSFNALTEIFTGGGNLGLGKPKFLSDQIYNKVLFGGGYQVPGGRLIRFTTDIQRPLAVKRFNTTFIRNLFFITNITRIVRLKLNRELSQSRNVIVSSHSAVATSVTEYGSDPFGKDETYDSTRLDGQTRYNDDVPNY